MKPANKNNPIAVGVLIGVLLVTLFLIFKQLNRENPVAPVITPVADRATTPNEMPTPPTTPTPGSSRDPFDHPTLHRPERSLLSPPEMTPDALAAKEAARMTPPGSKVSVFPVGVTPTGLWPLPPKSAQNRAGAPVLPQPGAVVIARPTGQVAALPVQEAADPLKGWRVTAIIAGQPLRAVIERAGAGPCQVGVGDHIHGMQVTAIHEREIVLRDAIHLLTLPLLTVPGLPDGNSDSRENATGAVSGSQSVLTSTRENDNGTANHP